MPLFTKKQLGPLPAHLLLGALLFSSQLLHAVADSTATAKPKKFKEYLMPGKVDEITTFKQKYLASNFMFWTQAIKLGFGAVFNGTDTVAHYGGTFFRPLAYTKYKGDLIIGANYYMPVPHITYWDIQIEHRHSFGLSYGGGAYNLGNTSKSINYWGKISFRKTINKWSFIITAQATPVTNGSKNTADHIRPGGYAAVYHPVFMIAGGYSYSQFRTCIGLMSPKEGAKYRPVFEALYIDNNAGGYTGVRYLFGNFTLGFDGGFLSNAARLGRAMGPTGLEFGNPLGFLTSPTVSNNWNRKLNSWEMGRMLNFRIEHFVLPNKTFNGYAQAVILPFQFDKKVNLLDPIFIGAEYVYSNNTKGALTNQGGILAGYFYNVKTVTVSGGFEYVINSHQPIITLGLIYKIL